MSQDGKLGHIAMPTIERSKTIDWNSIQTIEHAHQYHVQQKSPAMVNNAKGNLSKFVS